MDDCCENGEKNSGSSNVINKRNKPLTCPECHTKQKSVGYKAVLFHIRSPLNQTLPDTNYYFCTNADCKTVYFSETGVTFDKKKVRGHIGQKRLDDERTLCYCFGITLKQVKEEIKTQGFSLSKKWVKEQTKNHLCACDCRNPSGKCCLNDFP